MAGNQIFLSNFRQIYNFVILSTGKVFSDKITKSSTLLSHQDESQDMLELRNFFISEKKYKELECDRKSNICCWCLSDLIFCPNFVQRIFFAQNGPNPFSKIGFVWTLKFLVFEKIHKGPECVPDQKFQSNFWPTGIQTLVIFLAEKSVSNKIAEISPALPDVNHNRLEFENISISDKKVVLIMLNLLLRGGAF